MVYISRAAKNRPALSHLARSASTTGEHVCGLYFDTGRSTRTQVQRCASGRPGPRWRALCASRVAGLLAQGYPGDARPELPGDRLPGDRRSPPARSNPKLCVQMIDEAYATFRHPAVAPLVQSGANSFVLELFHGPTLAFKDVAMQLIARLMDHVLAERGRTGNDRRRHLRRHRRRRDRGLCRARPDRYLHPVSRRPGLAGSAAADDHLQGIKRACAGAQGQFR
jgi:hypothetical protein